MLTLVRTVLFVGLVLGVSSGLGADEPPALPPPAPAPLRDPAQVTFAREVAQAIERGVIWLASKAVILRADGGPFATWGPASNERSYGGGPAWTAFPSGPTALALYTLLKCGADPSHDLIQQGFAWMRERHAYDAVYDLETFGGPPPGGVREHRVPHHIYGLAVTVLALTALADAHKPSAKSRQAAKAGTLRALEKQDRDWLEEAVRELVLRQKNGGWGYGRVEGQPMEEDLSVSQLCALALVSAHRLGVAVEPQVLLDVADWTLRAQEAQGPAHPRLSAGTGALGESLPVDHARGFCYMPGSPAANEGRASGSMTACGVANLLLARELVASDKRSARRWEQQYEARCEAAVWDGVAWLDLHWSVQQNLNGYGNVVYYLYCIERGLDLLGKHLVGNHLWYEEGARHLLAIQQRQQVPARLGPSGIVDGSYWNTQTSVNPRDVLDTCFALLFLRRATIAHRAPVATGG